MASVAEAIPGVERHLIVAGDGPLIAKAEGARGDSSRAATPRGVGRPSATPGSGTRDGSAGFGALLIRAMPVGLAVRGVLQARLKALLRGIDPTIVHSNGIKTHILLKLSGFNEAPVIWHVRDFYGPRPLMARASEMGMRRCFKGDRDLRGGRSRCRSDPEGCAGDGDLQCDRHRSIRTRGAEMAQGSTVLPVSPPLPRGRFAWDWSRPMPDGKGKTCS